MICEPPQRTTGDADAAQSGDGDLSGGFHFCVAAVT